MADSLSLRDQLIESTIGLSRVCSMHKKSARTDLLILQALLDSADILYPMEQSKILCLSYNPKNQKSPPCVRHVLHVAAILMITI